jgi:probable F420-dependent oxidoreductase
MRLGLALPQLGPLADVDATRRVAVEAEAIGFDSLWALDRLLAPCAPRSAYPAMPDGVLPREFESALDPIGILTLAAAVTSRIGVGTSVLVAPWYAPALLARSLSTLDHVSHGRLTVGLGLGWSQDEYEAVGVPFANRGEQGEESLDVLEAVWCDEVVAYDGRRTRIAPSIVFPKPRQRPRPRLLLAAYTPAGLDRVVRRADGWMPALPLDVLQMMWTQLRGFADKLGRDPDSIEMVPRANIKLTTTPLGPDRPTYWGTRAQVADDLAATRELGATELVIELMGTARNASELLDIAADLAERIEHPLTPMALAG